VYRVTATPGIIPPNNSAEAQIDVVVKPPVAGLTVLFESSDEFFTPGTLRYTERETIAGGFARTFIRSAGYGMTDVTARLERNQGQSSSVRVIFDD